jgi:hypothetical protein
MSTHNAKPGEVGHVLPAAAAAHAPERSEQEEREMLILIDVMGLDFTEFHGTRAQLEAEGLIPEGTVWPNAYRRHQWASGKLLFILCRHRPEGETAPKKQFIDCDWWHLRQELLNPPRSEAREVMRKTAELAAALYLNTAAGRAASAANWSRYWSAENDQQFQSFKAKIPGLIPPKRGRPRGKRAEANQGGAAS